MDHIYAPLSGQIPISREDIPDTEAAIKFLRYRRSIRVYSDDSIPREILLQLLDIARFAPTGTNTQGLRYLVVSGRECLSSVTGAVVEWLEQKLTKPGSRMPQTFWEPVEEYRKGRDALLRNAPHLIVALTPPEIAAVSRDSARLSLEYVELLAPTMGIGTCWMGILQLCAGKKYPPLMEALGIKGDEEVVGVITAGYPRYRYQRLVDRDPLDVHWI
jgi:nitroreductase